MFLLVSCTVLARYKKKSTFRGGKLWGVNSDVTVQHSPHEKKQRFFSFDFLCFCWCSFVFPTFLLVFLTIVGFSYVPSVCVPSSVGIDSRQFLDMSQTLPEHIQNISRKNPGQIPDGPSSFLEYFIQIIRHLKDISWTCLRNVPEMSWTFRRDVLDTPWTFPGHSLDIALTFLEISRGHCPGHFPEMSKKIPGHLFPEAIEIHSTPLAAGYNPSPLVDKVPSQKTCFVTFVQRAGDGDGAPGGSFITGSRGKTFQG